VVSNAIGVQRSAEWTSPNVGQLVEAAIAEMKALLGEAMVMELSSWFRHPAGFFAGRGTGKAPDPRPVEVDLEVVARLLDRVWRR